jgi:2-succinyl-6-hydroxy-2,4-cyclohexadiene-1-carboxylate synthase
VALWPEYYTLEHTAARVEELLTRLSLPRVHLVGYSLGARCAMMYARLHPLRLASLTLVSGNPGIDEEALRARRRDDDAALAASITSEGLHRFVERWTAMALLARNDASSTTRRERLGQRSRGLAASLLGAGQGRQPALWNALAALNVPMLAVAGERDAVYAEHARRLEREAGATARIIPHCGHDVPVEQADALSAALREFWKRVDGAHC